MNKVLIVEFNNYHEEVILPQVEFLNAEKREVHLYINSDIMNKNIDFKCSYINKIVAKNKFTKLSSIFSILYYIKKNQIDTVIFNTLNCKYVSILNIFLSKRLKKIAIVHNVDTFEKNSLDLKNFFVLSENVLENVKQEYKSQYNFNYFYPLIYNMPTFNSYSNSKLKVVIPGLVEFSRRDYLGLLDILKDTTLNNIEFIILGNIDKLDGPIVYEKIQEYKLEKNIHVYHGFIPYNVYFNTLQTADLIMPLIHPNIENFEKYHTTKITAAFSMAFSFKVPLILYNSLYKLDEFKSYSIGYTMETLALELSKLDKTELKNLNESMRNSKKFTFEYQRKNYIDFLGCEYE